MIILSDDVELLQLGYSTAWIDAGILTPAEFKFQLEEFLNGGDQNLEHYRFRTAMRFLETQNSFSDSIIIKICDLLKSDPDESMATSVLISMLKMRTVNDEQFHFISRMFSTFGSWTEKYITQQQTNRAKNR